MFVSYQDYSDINLLIFCYFRVTSSQRQVFYQHLRPEFVRRYSKPLSSDAFTL